MHEKLLKIQQELKVPKGQMNKFGGYRYRSCEDIVEAAKPLCHAEGLVLTLSDEVVCIGNRNYVKAKATLSASVQSKHSDYEGVLMNDALYVTAYAREEETKKGMDGAQITGAASSYARKYALNGLFAIDDTADPDATNNHGKGDKVEYPEPPAEDDFTI